MPGVSFDRAARFYDATRGYAPGSAEQIRDGIVRYTGATTDTHFLELGVGTGRIALPFIQAGYNYTGVDLSEAMMDELRAKLAADPHAATYRATLQRADVTALPFADASFDVVLAVHVLHLVSDRMQTIREARRVLKPGGVFLAAYDGPDADEHGQAIPARQVRNRWLDILHEMHVNYEARRSQWVNDEVIERDLQQLGARTEIVTIAPYERGPVSARHMADLIIGRSFSSDWATSDAVHAEATRRLEAWIAETFTNHDEPHAMRGDVIAVAGRW